jgi:hypothetical protein
MDSSNNFEAQVQAFVTALNDRAIALTAAGRRPLYRDFGFTIGPKHARIFSQHSPGSRSSRAFFGRDGLLRRADSWKQAGRVLGTVDSAGAFAYVFGVG